ncbi:hypothetical protein, partial [Yersinia pestis]
PWRGRLSSPFKIASSGFVSSLISDIILAAIIGHHLPVENNRNRNMKFRSIALHGLLQHTTSASLTGASSSGFVRCTLF